ncbi:hypothetical protein B0H14DRAFT_3131807 [Mycena olivaceomarginata]|nr:hypothetical protein B0H14DRAFT_3131807 [Mycena olivaceomarginata]
MGDTVLEMEPLKSKIEQMFELSEYRSATADVGPDPTNPEVRSVVCMSLRQSIKGVYSQIDWVIATEGERKAERKGIRGGKVGIQVAKIIDQPEMQPRHETEKNSTILFKLRFSEGATALVRSDEIQVTCFASDERQSGSTVRVRIGIREGCELNPASKLVAKGWPVGQAQQKERRSPFAVLEMLPGVPQTDQRSRGTAPVAI